MLLLLVTESVRGRTCWLRKESEGKAPEYLSATEAGPRTLVGQVRVFFLAWAIPRL